jgi:hypothetical protein
MNEIIVNIMAELVGIIQEHSVFIPPKKCHPKHKEV